MTTILLKNARLVLADRIASGSLLLEGNKIDRVFGAGDTLPYAETVIDMANAYVAPGFVDIHIHGAHGVDVATADDAALDRLARWLALHGVTRFVPTLVPTSLIDMAEAVTRLCAWIHKRLVSEPSGAIPVGIHFEGPFVNTARCGALHARHFLSGNDRERFFTAINAPGFNDLPVRMITVAPEIEAGIDLVRDCAERGYIVSIGHTDADIEMLEEAQRAGARHMTHFANAMRPLHHRRPGPIAWGLTRKGITVDIIADLQHLHAEMIRLILGAKTPTRVALISDSIAPTGLGDGVHSVWGDEITITGRATANATGTIAGSVITMRDALANIHDLGFTVLDAVRMASVVPARIIGLETPRAIAAGGVADSVAFSEDLVTQLTLVAGRIVAHPAAETAGLTGGPE